MKSSNFSAMLIAFLVVFLISNSYSKGKIDSLCSLLKETNDNVTKVELLESLSRQYIQAKNYEKAIGFASEALNLSQWERLEIGVINCYRLIAFCYYQKGNYKKALENYFAIVFGYKNTSDQDKLAETYLDISRIYNNLDDPLTSIKFTNYCQKHLSAKSDPYIRMESYFNFSKSYHLLGKYEEQIAFLKKEIELRSIHDPASLGVGYNSLGNAFWHLDKFDSAIKYYRLYNNISSSQKDTVGQAIALSNIGTALNSKGEYKNSIKYFKYSLRIKNSNTAYTYLEMLQPFCKIGALDEATTCFKLARENGADPQELINGAKALAHAYSKSGNIAISNSYYEIADKLYEKLIESSTREVALITKNYYDVAGIEERFRDKSEKVLINENSALQRQNNFYLLLLLILSFIILIFLSYTLIKVYRKKNQAAGRLAEMQNSLQGLYKAMDEDLKNIKKLYS